MTGTIARVPLGGSAVTVTRIGLGTAPLAGLFDTVAEETALATLRAAWDAGIRYFDTAPHYGPAVAERLLGAFLAELAGRDPAARREAVVATKVGRVLEPGESPAGTDGFQVSVPLVRRFDFTAEGVYRSLADSLERTGLESFDLLLIHDPDDDWETAAGAAYPALARLRAEGAVRAIGVGMNQAEMLTRFVRETDVDFVLVAGRYSLLDRGAEAELLPACLDRGAGVIVGGVFNSGVLADPYAAGTHFDYASVPPPVLAAARRMADRCAAHGVPLAAAALAFPLRHPAVTGIVVGARTPGEITHDVELAGIKIPDALWAELAGELPS